MGRVYRATDPEGELVALKLVRGDLAEDSVFRRRFEREAMIAQQVKNPHVVPVLDTGEHEGVPYLSQRFVEGGSLEQKLKRDGKLDVPTTLEICAQVADGLDALFAGGMVHRDVKPANVLLDLRRHRADHRLRSGQGQPGDRAHAARPGARLDGLHVARADPRRGGHRGDRRVLARLRACASASPEPRRLLTARACACCGRSSRTSRPTPPPICPMRPALGPRS